MHNYKDVDFNYDKVAGVYRVRKTFSVTSDIIPPKEVKTHFSNLSMNGTITIEKGFVWDGASGAFDTPNIMLASCIHDALCYWMVQEKLDYDMYWDLANDLMRDITDQAGMSKARKAWVHAAITAHGRLKYGVQ
jgi:hypothetical protein